MTTPWTSQFNFPERPFGELTRLIRAEFIQHRNRNCGTAIENPEHTSESKKPFIIGFKYEHIRFKTLRRDNRLENPAKPQRLRMSNEQAEAKRNPTVSNYTKKHGVVKNPVGLDGLPLSDYLILIGKRDAI